MKKVVLVLLLAVMVVLPVSVNAMTESELREKLTASYTVNGRTDSLDDSVIVIIDRYLSTYELSSDDCDYISDKIDEGLEIVRAGSATEWHELTSSEKEQLIALVSDISDNTSVKLSLNKAGTLTIYNSDGTVFATLSDLVKYTDAESSTMEIVTMSALSLVGLYFIVRKVAKGNA